jgi:hypothetical protein
VLLCANAAQASLQLRLKTEGLSPAEQQASQALLDEAMRALPPRFIEQLDRRIDVGWTDKMPDNAYGQASWCPSWTSIATSSPAWPTAALPPVKPPPPRHRAPGNARHCAA